MILKRESKKESGGNRNNTENTEKLQNNLPEW